MPIIVEPETNPDTTLSLGRLWLNSVDNPADLMSFAISSFTPSKEIGGEVRDYANGRLRLVRRARVSRARQANVRRPTTLQLDWLDDHAGELVTVRDPDGGKFVGTYLALSYERPTEGADMTLSLTQVTSSEAV